MPQVTVHDQLSVLTLSANSRHMLNISERQVRTEAVIQINMVTGQYRSLQKRSQTSFLQG